MKYRSKGDYKKYLVIVEGEFYVMAGGASFFFDLLKAGGIGGVLSLANIFPNVCAALYNYFIEGRIDEAEKINENLVNLNKQVSGMYSVTSVKAAMDILGYVGGVPRKPLKPLAKAQINELENAIKKSVFFRK